MLPSIPVQATSLRRSSFVSPCLDPSEQIAPALSSNLLHVQHFYSEIPLRRLNKSRFYSSSWAGDVVIVTFLCGQPETWVSWTWVGREQTGFPVTKLLLLYFLWRYQRRYTRLSHTRSNHVSPRAKFFLPEQASLAMPGATGAVKSRRAGTGQLQQVAPQPAPLNKSALGGDRLGATFCALVSLGSDNYSFPSLRPPNPAVSLRSLPPPARRSRSPEPGRASAMPAQTHSPDRRPSCRACAQLAHTPPIEPQLSARRRSAAASGRADSSTRREGRGRGRCELLGAAWVLACRVPSSAAPSMTGKSRKSETLFDTAKEEEKKTNSEEKKKKASSGNKLTFCLAIGLPPAFQSPAERAKSRRVGTGQLGPLSQCVRGAFSRHRSESRDVLSGCLAGGSRDRKKVHTRIPIVQLMLQTNLVLQL